MKSTDIFYANSAIELMQVLKESLIFSDDINNIGIKIVAALKQGNKLLTCGNGGSAADALHLAEELVGRYKVERRGLPAICLNSDVTSLTCIGNDYGYDYIFSRQIEALGKPGDVLVGFSTSGNSKNVINAFRAAKIKGIETVFLGGKDGGLLKGICNFEVIVPSFTTARIQEIHTVILHQWLEFIDSTDWNILT